MRSFYALLLLLFTGTISAQNKKLVIIGSSTSACTSVSFSDCYVARLDAYYNGINHPVNVDIVQLAVGGHNVYRGMPSSYTPSGLPGPYNYSPDVNNNITKALTLDPDVILVNYPTNAFDVLTIGQIMFAFRTIRDSGVAAGVPVFITTSQPRQNAPEFDDLAERARLKEVRDSILVQFGTTAVNFWDGIADPTTYQILPAYNADNIHLNAAGHQILFERVRDANIFAASVLPVKLRSFNATHQQAQVNITWSVNDELPGTRYEVQRSTDGINYKTFHTVTSTGTAASRSYNATDADAVSGIFYYRLKIVEQSKSFYSQVVKLALKNKLALKSFSVDADRKQLVMKLNASETVRVQFNFVSSTGQLVSKATHTLQQGENRLALPLNSLPAGTYWADAITEQQKIFTKGFRVY
jgi:lysophospholipase L1-like esterase